MKNKRGQITIFIIIAIIIVVAIVLFFTLKDKINVEDKKIPAYAQDVKDNVELCLEKSLNGAIIKNGLHGGYSSISGEYLFFDDGELYFEDAVPYYLINRDKNIPSKEDLQIYLSNSIIEILTDCLDDFDSVKEIKYDFNSIDLEVFIFGEKIRAHLFLPTIITFDNSSVIVEEFEIESESKYYSLYSLANELTSSQLDNFGNFCLTCFVDTVEREGYLLSTTEIEDNNTYVFVHVLSTEDSYELFGFAYKFEFGELK